MNLLIKIASLIAFISLLFKGYVNCEEVSFLGDESYFLLDGSAYEVSIVEEVRETILFHFYLGVPAVLDRDESRRISYAFYCRGSGVFISLDTGLLQSDFKMRVGADEFSHEKTFDLSKNHTKKDIPSKECRWLIYEDVEYKIFLRIRDAEDRVKAGGQSNYSCF